MKLNDLREEIKRHADKQRAHLCQRFFKTGAGEYGHGDVFLGLSVPQQRKIARHYRDLPLAEVIQLLKSKIHEERFTALVLLVYQYQKGDDKTKDQIFRQYLANSKWINNWDLVDMSTPQIVGDWCWRHGEGRTIQRLAHSHDLWERRIGVLGTFTYIRNRDFRLPLEVAKALLDDQHDLIHKAVGWMLREAYKREREPVVAFLDHYAHRMPRVMLRYALEKMPYGERQEYMARPSTVLKRKAH